MAIVRIVTNDQDYNELVPLAVAQFIAWLLGSLSAQFVIVASSLILIGCAAIYEQFISIPNVYVNVIIDLISIKGSWL